MKDKKLFFTITLIILILVSITTWHYFNKSYNLSDQKNKYIDVGTFIDPDYESKNGLGFQGEKGKITNIGTGNIKIDFVKFAENKTKVKITGRHEMGPGISCSISSDCPDRKYFILEKVEILKEKE